MYVYIYIYIYIYNVYRPEGRRRRRRRERAQGAADIFLLARLPELAAPALLRVQDGAALGQDELLLRGRPDGQRVDLLLQRLLPPPQGHALRLGGCRAGRGGDLRAVGEAEEAGEPAAEAGPLQVDAAHGHHGPLLVEEAHGEPEWRPGAAVRAGPDGLRERGRGQPGLAAGGGAAPGARVLNARASPGEGLQEQADVGPVVPALAEGAREVAPQELALPAALAVAGDELTEPRVLLAGQPITIYELYHMTLDYIDYTILYYPMLDSNVVYYMTYVYIYIYIYMYMYIYTHTYTYIDIHVYIYI